MRANNFTDRSSVNSMWLGKALNSIKSRTASEWPLLQAQCKAVMPWIKYEWSTDVSEHMKQNYVAMKQQYCSTISCSPLIY